MSRTIDLSQIARLNGSPFDPVGRYTTITTGGIYLHEPWLPASGAVSLSVCIRPSRLQLLVIDGRRPMTITDGGVNEVQRLTITGAAGNYSLDFNSQVTGSLAFNASAATVQSALQGLSNVGAGNIVCTGGPGGTAPIDITFTGALGLANQNQIIFGLVDPGLAASTLTTLTNGVAGTPLLTVRQGMPIVWHPYHWAACPIATDRDTLTLVNGSAIPGRARILYAYEPKG